MNLRRRQSGMSMISMLIIVIMVGFFVMCGIRLGPIYLEYLTVKKLITQIATEPTAGPKTTRSVRKRVENLLNMNQVNGITPKQVKIFRKKGKMHIDANYEVRIPMMGRIDAVMYFDDLDFIIEQPSS